MFKKDVLLWRANIKKYIPIEKNPGFFVDVSNVNFLDGLLVLLSNLSSPSTALSNEPLGALLELPSVKQFLVKPFLTSSNCFSICRRLHSENFRDLKSTLDGANGAMRYPETYLI